MKMTAKQAAEAIRRRKYAEASLACEGISLTEDEKRLFQSMEVAKLPHEERLRRIREYFRSSRKPSADAAE